MNVYNTSICLVGDIDTGKSTFLKYLRTKKFSEIFSPTIGVEFNSNLYTFDNYKIKWQIWDTNGQDVFSKVTMSYFRKGTVFFLFFNLNKKSSFLNLDKWIEKISSSCQTNFKIVLIGNKSDLFHNINYNQIEMFCKQYDLKYFEISLKNYDDISNIINYTNYYLQQIINSKYVKLEDYSMKLIENKNNLEENENLILENCFSPTFCNIL